MRSGLPKNTRGFAEVGIKAVVKSVKSFTMAQGQEKEPHFTFLNPVLEAFKGQC